MIPDFLDESARIAYQNLLDEADRCGYIICEGFFLTSAHVFSRYMKLAKEYQANPDPQLLAELQECHRVARQCLAEWLFIERDRVGFPTYIHGLDADIVRICSL